jgi:hypothetical protein
MTYVAEKYPVHFGRLCGMNQPNKYIPNLALEHLRRWTTQIYLAEPIRFGCGFFYLPVPSHRENLRVHKPVAKSLCELCGGDPGAYMLYSAVCVSYIGHSTGSLAERIQTALGSRYSPCAQMKITHFSLERWPTSSTLRRLLIPRSPSPYGPNSLQETHQKARERMLISLFQPEGNKDDLDWYVPGRAQIIDRHLLARLESLQHAKRTK